MPTRQERLAQLLDRKVIAVIRMTDTDRLMDVIAAIQKGGVEWIEITMVVPDAIDVLKEVSQRGGSAVIGAGTILDPETARLAILAGAEFIVSPILNLEVIKLAHRYDRLAIPGAFTPTEILTAWEAGADVVKVFPATALGPAFIKDVQGPLPQVKLCPTGGVTVENAGEFIAAGAACVGVGTDLLDKAAIAEGRYELLTRRAEQLVANTRQT
ncbi:MAG: bifunctional 4-hydroxy-2-oxoglutarate aldolase/2-dehydro-3-deoxy-phosphogluconate aldolase [Candidatus Marinimicrobia bacterium]|nr:bifunctional 4-hydroxy-2-oxoglutarate aldolase/2-dehydro-3-deoxy-phosphogluconate aldolase [Candidatus Neomarinimicrobiota bacterium]